MNQPFNFQTASVQFQQICTELGEYGKSLIAYGTKNGALVCIRSRELFGQFQPILKTGAEGQAPCLKSLRLLFGQYTSHVERLVKDDYSDAAYCCLSVDNNLAAAKRMCQRVTGRYMADDQSPLPPRKLFVGMARMIEELACGRLWPMELDRAFFWLDLSDDLLAPPKTGALAVWLLRAHPHLPELIREKVQIARAEGRVADLTVEALNTVFVAHCLEPVNSGDFLHYFYESYQPPEFDWTAEIFGFDVV